MKIVKVDQREFYMHDEVEAFEIYRVDHETKVGDQVPSELFDVNVFGVITKRQQILHEVTEHDLVGNYGIRYKEIQVIHSVSKKEPTKTKTLPELEKTEAVFEPLPSASQKGKVSKPIAAPKGKNAKK